MRARVLEQIEKAGGAPTQDGHVLWLDGTRLRLDVQANGMAELRLPWVSSRALVTRPSDLLRGNPEHGWSWILDHEGAWRRLVIGPAVWAQTTVLITEVDRLVAGTPSPARARHGVRLQPVRDDESGEVSRDLEDAVAIFCLATDGLARDGSRCVLRNGDALDVVLAGDVQPKVEARARREARVIEALSSRPDIASCLLAAWGFRAEHLVREGKGATLS
jgi:hypothetical protein